ncbi:hypothetical protein [Pedobacter nyackensis]|uniref:Crp/Fnr family transcriptional regulator n=1 Tax=Pedobacter nyackensis TaxID=475255 RepID=UPI002931A141|nr:hypothetical protein [Pedobacter nyackensis]
MNCKRGGENLLTYLCRHLGEESKLCEMETPLLEAQTLKKKHTFVKEGELNKNVFWLQSGYGRYFKVKTNEDGVEVEDTIDFCKPGKILFVRECVFLDLPGVFDLQLAAGTVIVPFQKEYFDALELDEAKMIKLINKILARDRPEGMKRMCMLKLRPRERYREFLKFFGNEIEQYFAIKHIASFLGMQPSYLSRLRGEYAKKKSEAKKYLQTVFFIMEFI